MKPADNYATDVDLFGPPPTIVVGRYAVAMPLYRAAGWPDVLPIRAGTKKLVETGVTGRNGASPDEARYADWCRRYVDGNVALRLPRGVVGIDLDLYKLDHAPAWDEFATGLPALPSTVMTTSRADRSGIRLYRVPDAAEFRGAFAWGEVIQHHHRYALVAPSIHPEGRPYRWVTTEGEHLEGVDGALYVPHVDELPELPPEWIEALRRPPTQAEQAADRAEGRRRLQRDHVQLDGWAPCVREAVEAAVGGLVRGCRHDTTVAAACRLARLDEAEFAGALDGWHAVRSAFVAAVAGERDGEKEADDAWTYALDGMKAEPTRLPTLEERKAEYRRRDAAVVRALVPSKPSDDAQAGDGAGSDDVDYRRLPVEFWQARPVLDHVRRAAWSRMRSAEAVLAAVLARVAAFTPPTVRLPAVQGSESTLSLYVALLAAPGVGKSTAKAVADELLPLPAGRVGRVVDSVPLGSGEGLIDAYFALVDEDVGGKVRKVKRKVHDGIYAVLDEGEVLGKMNARNGSTIVPALRTAWTGAVHGQANAGTETNRRLPALSYALGLVVGLQPTLAGELLADATAGTPQRFLWARAVADDLPALDLLPAWPGAIEWEPPSPVAHGSTVFAMTLAAPVEREVREAAYGRVTGAVTVDDLDAHADLLRLKIAGLFAVLDGRAAITVDDWELARLVVRMNRAVRSEVVEQVRLDNRRREEAADARVVRRELTIADSREGRALESMAKAIARKAHNVNGPVDTRTLRHATKGTDRQLATFDDAMAVALERGWIRRHGEGYEPGGSRPT